VAAGTGDSASKIKHCLKNWQLHLNKTGCHQCWPAGLKVAFAVTGANAAAAKRRRQQQKQQPLALKKVLCHFLVAKFFRTSRVTDFGRSIGSPIALAQTSCAMQPMHRETAKITV